MKKHEVNFAVKTENGVVTQVGRSAVLQPNPKFKGGSVKWVDDRKLVKASKAQATVHKNKVNGFCRVRLPTHLFFNSALKVIINISMDSLRGKG